MLGRLQASDGRMQRDHLFCGLSGNGTVLLPFTSVWCLSLAKLLFVTRALRWGTQTRCQPPANLHDDRVAGLYYLATGSDGVFNRLTASDSRYAITGHC